MGRVLHVEIDVSHHADSDVEFKLGMKKWL